MLSTEGNVLRIGDRRIPLVRRSIDGRDQWSMLINYRAPALVRNSAGELERPYASYEFRQLFAAEQEILTGKKPRLDPAVFKDKIVFIGLTASGLLDVFGTPVSTAESGSMPGIQLHASMTDSILANRFIRPATDPFAHRRHSHRGAGDRDAGRVPAVHDRGRRLARHPRRLDLVYGRGVQERPVAEHGPAAGRRGPGAVLRDRLPGTSSKGKEKRKVAKLFGRYVSRDVYSQLMANPDQAELGGKRREMTVLFSDIRGFTSVTERGDPEELVSQLNEYFSRMVEIVFRHKGTVDKFVGDMVMALFSAPLDDADHANHAVQAAVDMVKELGELNRAWAAQGMTQLDIGIGVNSGDMIAGNIGSSSIMSYTVIGDNVNLGARLESLNKDYKTRIIISDATRARLTGDLRHGPSATWSSRARARPCRFSRYKVPAPLVEEVKAT